MKEMLKKITEKVWLEGDPAKDRTVGLIIFGAIDILVGIFCFSLAMLMLITISATGLHGMKSIHFWMLMVFLFYLTVWFVVMGLGSIKARRWARALLLVGAWVSIFFGTLSLALILHVLPEIFNLVIDSNLISPSSGMGALSVITFILVVLQIIFPMVGVAFYGMENVKNTCELKNPKPSWTDHCPLPLLAMSFISGMGCFSILIAATTNYTVFLFGHVVSGFQGGLVMLFISLVCGYVGWGAFTRKMHAWWGAYLLVLLTSASMMLSFAEIEMSSLYVHMGYSAEQILLLRETYWVSSSALTFISCLWGIMACIYLGWVRDCFRPPQDEAEVKSYQQRKAEEAEAHPSPSTPRVRMRLD